MLGTKSTRHPTDDQLYDYCHARLGEVEASLVVRHLEQCPACARKLEKGQRLLTVLGGFTPEAYGAAYHRDILRRALLAAARRATRAAHHRRLAEWAVRESAFAGLVFQWSPGSTQGNAPSQLTLVRTFTGSSSWHLEAGAKPGKPLNATDPHAMAWPATPDHIGVLVRHWPEKQAAPLVVFARENDPAHAEVEVPRRHPKWHARVASFCAAKPGRFLLGFEPAPGLADHC